MKIAAIFATVIAAVLASYLGFVSLISYQMNASSSETWAAMQSATFECPAGQEVRLEGWGKLGNSRACSNQRNGKWEAWENGYKHIDGFYKDGIEHGVWTFYREDGTVQKTIEYNLGQEVGSDT
jgi:hypothetical protein